MWSQCVSVQVHVVEWAKILDSCITKWTDSCSADGSVWWGWRFSLSVARVQAADVATDERCNARLLKSKRQRFERGWPAAPTLQQQHLYLAINTVRASLERQEEAAALFRIVITPFG